MGYKTMDNAWNCHKPYASACMPADETADDLLLASYLAAAADGDMSACFDLGVAFSTGSHGAECDLVEAHKWFNLGAVGGHDEAAMCRADVAEEMTAREIAEAQRRARQWLGATSRKAA
jgi:TPR repeat protein